jgi:hypothetical protein
MIVCNICSAIFLNMDEEGRAKKAYEEHLKYCQLIKIKKKKWRKR